jgi:hypothetical protein
VFSTGRMFEFVIGRSEDRVAEVDDALEIAEQTEV